MYIILPGSIQLWRKDRKKSVWMKVPISQSYLIPVAFEHGFSYHHAVGDHAMLLKWLPKWEHNKVPSYATHQVGVSGNSDKLQTFFDYHILADRTRRICDETHSIL